MGAKSVARNPQFCRMVQQVAALHRFLRAVAAPPPGRVEQG